MILYLLTVSCQQKLNYVSKSDIDDVLFWIKMNESTFKAYNHSYERSGKYNQLHYHAIVEVKSSFRYKPFTQYGDINTYCNTFKIDWKRVTDFNGALGYVLKDTDNCPFRQEEILLLNYYKHHYFNMDMQRYERSDVSENDTKCCST